MSLHSVPSWPASIGSWTASVSLPVYRRRPRRTDDSLGVSTRRCATIQALTARRFRSKASVGPHGHTVCITLSGCVDCTVVSTSSRVHDERAGFGVDECGVSPERVGCPPHDARGSSVRTLCHHSQSGVSLHTGWLAMPDDNLTVFYCSGSRRSVSRPPLVTTPHTDAWT